jgi:hypothetical protein
MVDHLKQIVVFCGLVVSLLAIGLKVKGFKRTKGFGFLRAIKIRRTPSLRVGHKAIVPIS